jgi:hypothetical protein
MALRNNQSAITQADAEFVETWESVTDVQNYIIRLDVRGDEAPELVENRREFFITTQERLITQNKIKDKKHDPFTNGSFRPHVVPDSITVETNPNALSDDDIARIYASSDVAWAEYMKVIDSEATLRRMLEIAEDLDVSLKRFRLVEEKLEEVHPTKRIVQKDQELYDAMGPVGGSPQEPPRGTKPRVRMQSGRATTHTARG